MRARARPMRRPATTANVAAIEQLLSRIVSDGWRGKRGGCGGTRRGGRGGASGRRRSMPVTLGVLEVARRGRRRRGCRTSSPCRRGAAWGRRCATRGAWMSRAGHVVGRPGADVVVELPAVGAVLVLVDAVDGEVARLLGGEVRVLLLHAAEGVLDRGVAPGQAAGEPALLADPLVHPLGDRLGCGARPARSATGRGPRWRRAAATVSG